VRPEEVESLGWVDPPPKEQLEYGRSVLAGLGAVCDKGLPTARGRQLGSLPLHPRLAHLIVRCDDAAT
jgi:ATP-dependent helicase HrpB